MLQSFVKYHGMDQTPSNFWKVMKLWEVALTFVTCFDEPSARRVYNSRLSYKLKKGKTGVTGKWETFVVGWENGMTRQGWWWVGKLMSGTNIRVNSSDRRRVRTYLQVKIKGTFGHTFENSVGNIECKKRFPSAKFAAAWERVVKWKRDVGRLEERQDGAFPLQMIVTRRAVRKKRMDRTTKNWRQLTSSHWLT